LKPKYLLVLLFAVVNFAAAQSGSEKYFQGYKEEVSGKRFGYHSPLPDVNTCLLLRGRSDYSPLEWKTGVIPENYPDNFVTVMWIFGMDVTSDPVEFDLAVNGLHILSFKNSRRSGIGERIVKGDKGSELTLNITMVDKYKDQMGFAVLKIPVQFINRGEAALIKVSTKTVDNDAWFMTFKSGVEEKIDIYQNKVVVKDRGKLFHSISVDFVHIGRNAEAKVAIGRIKAKKILKAGFNKLEVYLPMVRDTSDFTASVQVTGKKPILKSFTLAPVRKWEIFLVQHTHTDIGYTRPQTEILPEHLRYIDTALDLCDQTDELPDAAKFRWTCETSWSVREYLKSRPAGQIKRLLRRMREGRIEATGMFLNFSEIADESTLAAQTKVLRMLKNAGIDVVTAMQNDVNGIGWCLVDYFQNTGVKYLTMGIHAHRARKPFNKPTSFWWQAPSGNRLLAYRSEHYQHGNSLSLTTGQQDVFRTNLSHYLTGLENKNYPYNKISLQFSGYVTDNSPPSKKVCNIIKDWNEKYEWPKLRSALARDFMIYLDEQHAEDLPQKKVAWPDWWTDGTASAANETKVVRNAQVKLAAVTALLSMARIAGVTLPTGISEEVEEVYDDILFYDEHTHGAAESVTDPLSENTVNQWGAKISLCLGGCK